MRLATVLLLLASAAAALDPASVIQHDGERLTWIPAARSFAPGAEVAVLDGNPRQEGLFTIRVRLPAGARLAPHKHPAEERITVLEGSLHVGEGASPDKPGRRLEAGAFYVNPAGSFHYLWTKGGAVLQITGEGPWASWLPPAFAGRTK